MNDDNRVGYWKSEAISFGMVSTHAESKEEAFAELAAKLRELHGAGRVEFVNDNQVVHEHSGGFPNRVGDPVDGIVWFDEGYELPLLDYAEATR